MGNHGFNEPVVMMFGMIIDRNYAPLVSMMLNHVCTVMEGKMGLISQKIAQCLSMSSRLPSWAENGSFRFHDDLKHVLKVARDEVLSIIEKWLASMSIEA